MGGKMCQIWGGFEYDENPMYIYEYSELVGHMDNFKTGIILSLKPVPTQEIAFEVSDANSGKLEEDYGANPVLWSDKGPKPLEQANHPLAFIVNWNGIFFGDKLQTRWAWGIQKQAKGAYSRMLTLGQRLNLPKLQWYIDYMGAFDDMDRLGIATDDMLALRETVYTPDGEAVDDPLNIRAGKVHYNAIITKLNWQFAPKWNLMLKGTYETANVKNVKTMNNYRKFYGCVGSIEYYPVPKQDFRLFLAYVGKKFNYSDECGIANSHMNRIELGLMYRIKCY